MFLIGQCHGNEDVEPLVVLRVDNCFVKGCAELGAPVHKPLLGCVPSRLPRIAAPAQVHRPIHQLVLGDHAVRQGLCQGVGSKLSRQTTVDQVRALFQGCVHVVGVCRGMVGMLTPFDLQVAAYCLALYALRVGDR